MSEGAHIENNCEWNKKKSATGQYNEGHFISISNFFGVNHHGYDT